MTSFVLVVYLFLGGEGGTSALAIPGWSSNKTCWEAAKNFHLPKKWQGSSGGARVLYDVTPSLVP